MHIYSDEPCLYRSAGVRRGGALTCCTTLLPRCITGSIGCMYRSYQIDGLSPHSNIPYHNTLTSLNKRK